MLIVLVYMSRTLVLLSILATIGVNALANILPINNITTGEVSDIYDNYFTPAGFTFSIWSIIYLALIIFGFWQLKRENIVHHNVAAAIIVNGIANMLWIVCWHYQLIPLTMVLMLVILASLVYINIQINGLSRWIRIPFRLYFGWICVAAIANGAALLVYFGWSGHPIDEPYWGSAMVAAAGILGLYLIFTRGYVIPAFVIAWGVFGIYMQQQFLDRAIMYQYVCIAVLVVLLGTSGWKFVQSRFVS